jgi:uncharacterized protein
VSRRGGHVGFIGGSPIRPEYWLSQRVTEYLADYLKS